jgi:hypothetical protein
MSSFTTPSCTSNQNLLQSVMQPACPANLFPNTFLVNTEAECATCNPFGFYNNPALKDGCYKWAFKIQCNDANKKFVENPFNPSKECSTTFNPITCFDIVNGAETLSLGSLKEGNKSCGCGCSNPYRGYDIQGSFFG